MTLPVHRWFRYSAGFSAKWAEAVIRDSDLRGGWVLDPFAGSGTALLAAQRAGVPSVGAENHPFIARVAAAKLCWKGDAQRLLDAGRQLISDARGRDGHLPSDIPALLPKCYSPEALTRLWAIKAAYVAQRFGEGETEIGELLWLAITAILRECSGVGTAQWQYVLPTKTKAKVRDPFSALIARLEMFCIDMRRMKEAGDGAPAHLRLADARSLNGFEDLIGKVGLVITSPPYPNNYDYADATRLEMTFWGEIGGWGDLQNAVRHRLVRSCSQHTAAERLRLSRILLDPSVAPIADELAEVCNALERVRETKGGRKTYHTMVAAYFVDLARTWQAVRPLCAPGASVCCVIGDSAPYGVHVPVEDWLGKLALAAGFISSSFQKVRDRNLKWKNRKHRVPLKEGNLWLRS